MFAKFAVPAVIMACIFAGCGSSTETPAIKAKPVVSRTTSLNGIWINADPSDPTMEAHISDSSIRINIVTDDGVSLYWQGTTPKPRKYLKDPTALVSFGDTRAMDRSVLGSQDDFKVFFREGDELQFQFTIVGTSRIIELQQ